MKPKAFTAMAVLYSTISKMSNFFLTITKQEELEWERRVLNYMNRKTDEELDRLIEEWKNMDEESGCPEKILKKKLRTSGKI